MTTKIEDAVSEAVRLLNDVGYHDAAANLSDYYATQHAEAGAVAWQVIDKMLVAAYEHGLNSEPMDMMAMQARYAAIHPAQPASQQGEDANGDDPSPSDYRRCLKCGFVVDVALGSCKPGTDAPMLPHPTGDKVRGGGEAAQINTVDCIGLALDLEKQADRGEVVSQTAERAMRAAAHGLRLVEKWREKANEYVENAHSSLRNKAYRECADELAAALDQEKNDGTR